MQNALVFILRQVKSCYLVTLWSCDLFSRKSSLGVVLVLTLSHLQVPITCFNDVCSDRILLGISFSCVRIDFSQLL